MTDEKRGLGSLLRRFTEPRGAGHVMIEAKDLEQRVSQREDILIIDVREADEFVGPFGHIPGARHIALGDIQARIEQLSGEKERPIALVCRTDKRSASAAALLGAAGFKHVMVLRNGMEQWNRERFEVDNSAPG